MGVSGTAAKLSVSITTEGFATLASRPFTIRGIQVLRPAADRVVVKAAISGAEAVAGARVVAIHLDKSGRVVGGDFAIVDIPRVELYVIPSA